MLLPVPPQQDAAPQPLPEVVVVAPRSEATVTTNASRHTVLSAEDLRRTGARTLPTMIARAGDVWMQETNLGGGAPILRGLNGNRILIVVDGVRLNDSTTREGPNQSLATIDPGIVERVEVYQGPASVPYGSDAIGGVILVWTKRARPTSVVGGENGLGGFAEGQYGTAYQGGRGSLGVDRVGDRFGALGVASGARYNDLRSGGGEVENTGYDRFALFGSYEHLIEDGRDLRFIARMNRDFDVPRTDRLNVGFGQTQPNSELWHFALQDRRAYQIHYTDVAENGFFDRFQTRLSLRTYEEERQRRSTGSSTQRIENDEVTTVGLGADWKKSIGDDQLLTFGFDLNHDEVDSMRRDTDLSTGVTTSNDGSFAPNSEYSTVGVFVQDEIFAFDPFFLTAGLRWSYYDFSFDDFSTGQEESGDFDALTASLEASREFDDWRISAGIAQGFRAPNLADLAKDGSFAGGTELSNPDLEPEESLTVDLGAEYGAGRWTASGGVYATRIDDLVARRFVNDGGTPGVPGDDTFERVNVSRLEIYGAQAAAEYRFSETSPWSVGGRLAWAEGTQKGDGVTPGFEVDARRIPPVHGRSSLKWTDREGDGWFGWADFSVLFAFEQNDLNPQDTSDPRIDPSGTDGWLTLNLDVGGAIDESSDWWAGVHNLLDEEYRVHASGFDAPGIGFVLGLRISR